MLQNGLAVLYYLWGTGQRPVRRPTPAKRRFVPTLGHGTASREFRHTFEPASRDNVPRFRRVFPVIW